MNKWIAIKDSKRFEIEEDEGIGFYLYVYEGEKCVKDHLQDTFEFAVEQASEDFGVDPDSWRRVMEEGPGRGLWIQ